MDVQVDVALWVETTGTDWSYYRQRTIAISASTIYSVISKMVKQAVEYWITLINEFDLPVQQKPSQK